MSVINEGFSIFRGENRRLGVLAMLTAALALLLFFCRLNNTVSISEPLQVLTSGDEVASLFAIWKAKQGLDVYVDRFQSPYSFADFNWLFYATNAVWTDFWLNVLGLSDAWLPTLTRTWTLVGCAAGASAAFLLFRDILRKQDAANNALALGVALLLVSGPLYGFWAITARPDVWAISLELIGIAAFISLYRSHPLTSVIIVSVLANMAWAFKQTTVFGLGSVGFFLLFRRDFKLLVLLTVTNVLFWAATIFSLSPNYFETLFAVGHPLHFTLERALRNLSNFALKTTYLWLPLAGFLALLMTAGRKAFDLKDDALLLALCGVAFTFPVTFALASQTESSENYYFTPAFFMAFLVICLVSRIKLLPMPAQALIMRLSEAGFILTTLAILTVLFGVSGTMQPSGNQKLITEQIRCLDALKRPLYVSDRLLSLPWNTPNNTPYVRSYHYELERTMGRAFEYGGIGGLIKDGQFATIAIPGKTAPDFLDGAPLGQYHLLPQQCGGISIFVRNP